MRNRTSQKVFGQYRTLRAFLEYFLLSCNPNINLEGSAKVAHIKALKVMRRRLIRFKVILDKV